MTLQWIIKRINEGKSTKPVTLNELIESLAPSPHSPEEQNT